MNPTTDTIVVFMNPTDDIVKSLTILSRYKCLPCVILTIEWYAVCL